jgi:APA family basic amino acid/polyamine antiporter
VKDPKKNIPLSLLYGTIIVTILYVSANIIYLIALPISGTPDAGTVAGRGIQFATQDRVGTAVATVMFGDSASLIMAILIMISTFGCNNGLILAGARVYYAMAKDKLFFRSTAELNANAVPEKGLIFQTIWASILCLSGTYGDLLDYVIFAVLIFYVLTIVGVFILRKKKPDVERPYKAFGYPIVPALYIVIASALCVNLLFTKPQFTWPGLFIVLLGIPIYYLWTMKSSSRSSG